MSSTRSDYWRALFAVRTAITRTGNRRALGVMTILCAAVLAASATTLTYWRTESHYRHLATDTTRSTLRQTQHMRESLVIVFNALREHDNGDPCSADNRQLMKRLRYVVPIVAAVGFIQDNRLMCASFNMPPKGLFVGLPEGTGLDSTGIRVRAGVPIKALGPLPMTLLSLDGRTVIIPSDPAYQISPEARAAGALLWAESTVAEGVANSIKLHYASGTVPEALAQAARGKGSLDLLDNWLIVRQRTPYGVTGVAAIPRATIASAWLHQLLRTVPPAVLLSPFLAWLLIILARGFLAASWRLCLRSPTQNLEVVYQPIVELATGRWAGLTATVRQRLSDGTYETLTAGELAGHNLQTGEQLLTLANQAMRDNWGHFGEHENFSLFADFLSRGLLDSALAVRLKEQLGRYGVYASRFICGLSEHAFKDEIRAEKIVTELRSTGARVSVEDFGLGFAGLSYLAKLDLDYIKLGATFVHGLGTDKTSAVVLSQFVSLAQALGVKVIAQGVETLAQAKYLRAKGVQLANGPFFQAEDSKFVEDDRAPLPKVEGLAT